MSILNTSPDARIHIIWANYSEKSSKIASVISGFVHASIQACIDKVQ